MSSVSTTGCLTQKRIRSNVRDEAEHLLRIWIYFGGPLGLGRSIMMKAIHRHSFDSHCRYLCIGIGCIVRIKAGFGKKGKELYTSIHLDMRCFAIYRMFPRHCLCPGLCITPPINRAYPVNHPVSNVHYITNQPPPSSPYYLTSDHHRCRLVHSRGPPVMRHAIPSSLLPPTSVHSRSSLPPRRRASHVGTSLSGLPRLAPASQ